MKKPGALASALRSSGAAVAASKPGVADDGVTSQSHTAEDRQPSRIGTKAITVHFPEAVRRQLKAMAGEEGRDVADMVAEALNLLFVKYRKAELAPRKATK
jgi:CHASE2 domain-containing sensor protein